MRFKPGLNAVFGITIELLYAFSIILVALLTCLVIYFKS